VGTGADIRAETGGGDLRYSAVEQYGFESFEKMNILIPHSWLLDFLKTEAKPEEIARLLSLSGPSVESVSRQGNDWVYDIEVTTNRIDMYSVLGIAKEAAVILNAPLRSNLCEAKVRPCVASVNYLKVKVDRRLCPRFAAALIENVKVKPSPPEVQKRLTLAGHRPINNIVDISNYLMHAYGQPVHVFDWDLIGDHKMILRESMRGEKITTLDGKTFSLAGGDIVIEDGRGKLIDLCGIMGGANSAVSEKTKNVLLFVQKYDPKKIRKTSLRLSQRTVAAQIFEKDPDIEAVGPVLAEGIGLLKKWANGKAKNQVLDIWEKRPAARSISLSWQVMDTYLNRQVKHEEALKILTDLGFEVKEIATPRRTVGTRNDGVGERIEATPPSWLANGIGLDVDLIEEIARIWGYGKFESLIPEGKIPLTDPGQKLQFESEAKTLAAHLGYTELYTTPLVSVKEIEVLGAGDESLKLTNPLSDEWEFLRTSLWPGLLAAMKQNEPLAPVAVFELAPVFLKRSLDFARDDASRQLPEEKLRLTLATHRPAEIVLGHLTAMAGEWGIDTRVEMAEVENLAEGKGGVVYSNKLAIGTIGQVDGKVMTGYGLRQPAWILDLDFDLIKKLAAKTVSLRPAGKFSAITEDITLTLPPKTTIGPIIEAIKKKSGLIHYIKVVGSWENTLTIRVEFNSDIRQLTQAEVNKEKEEIVNHLRNPFHIFRSTVIPCLTRNLYRFQLKAGMTRKKRFETTSRIILAVRQG
jgi:phenylalanyl-tRNA synthetase beta chain